MAAYKNPTPKVDDDDDMESIIEREKSDSETDYSDKKEIYFAFIDVLGFKKAFDEYRTNAKCNYIDNFRDVFNYFFELMNSTNLIINKKTTECYAGQTSDSLYFYTPRSDMLLEFITAFLHFNLYAMSKGVFFRGGIAKGNLFIRNDFQFYGESVIYAYLLESSIAKYPITVIDQNTYDAINKWDPKICNTLVQKHSARYYLNMFAFEKKDVEVILGNPSFELKEIDYKQILKNIQENIQIFEYDVKNHEKYIFLLKEYEKHRNIFEKNE